MRQTRDKSGQKPGVPASAKFLTNSCCGLSCLMKEELEILDTLWRGAIDSEDWEQAASGAGNLSRFYLVQGELRHAITVAQQGVDLADRSNDLYWQGVLRSYLANALHQVGDVAQAKAFFREAEILQEKREPDFRLLYSHQGFYFYDLLLDLGHIKKVRQKALRILDRAAKEEAFADMALSNLSQGYTYLLPEGSCKDFSLPLRHINRAVDLLQGTGIHDFQIRALLARAALLRKMEIFFEAWRDLEEIREVAERRNMVLYHADYHLEAARLCKDLWQKGAADQKKEAEMHLVTADKMINKMRYHRRDKELKALYQSLEIGAFCPKPGP